MEGEAKDLIRGCLKMGKEGYRKAREYLEKEYGNPFLIANAYINKIQKWQPIKADDYKDLKRLSLYLNECYHSMSSLDDMSILNHAPYIKEIVQKLPSYLRNRWLDHITKMKRKEERQPRFADLCEFVEFAAEAANNPIYSFNLEQKATDPVKGTNSNTQTPNTGSAKYTKHQICIICKMKHDIEDCEQFTAKSLQEKKDYLFQNRLCFSCFSNEHLAKFCSTKRVCSLCQRRHPTSLHNPDPTENRDRIHESPRNKDHHEHEAPEEYSRQASVGNASNVFQAIVPVKVKSSNGIYISTYAFIDNGSSSSFITEQLLQELDLSSIGTSLRLSTINGTDTIQSRVISNLEVSDLHGINTVRLPRSYTVAEIPVSQHEIPQKKSLLKFSYLSQLVNDIPDYDPRLDVGLLIGCNCPEAMKPLKVLSGESSGPVGILYPLGWTVVGPTSLETVPRNVNCNKMEIFELPLPFEHDYPNTMDRMAQAKTQPREGEKEKNIGDACTDMNGRSREKVRLDISEALEISTDDDNFTALGNEACICTENNNNAVNDNDGHDNDETYNDKNKQMEPYETDEKEEGKDNDEKTHDTGDEEVGCVFENNKEFGINLNKDDSDRNTQDLKIDEEYVNLIAARILKLNGNNISSHSNGAVSDEKMDKTGETNENKKEEYYNFVEPSKEEKHRTSEENLTKSIISQLKPLDSHIVMDILQQNRHNDLQKLEEIVMLYHKINGLTERLKRSNWFIRKCFPLERCKDNKVEVYENSCLVKTLLSKDWEKG